MPRNTISGSHNRWPDAQWINGCQMINDKAGNVFTLPTGYDKLLTRITRKNLSHSLASRVNGRETVGGSGPLRPMAGATCTSSNNCFTPTYVRDNVTSHVQGWGESAHPRRAQKYMLGSDNPVRLIPRFSFIHWWGVLIK